MSFPFLLGGLWLALLGVLVAPNIILSRRPAAAHFFKKLSAIQGWIGVISVIGAVFMLIKSLLNVRWIASSFTLWFSSLLGSLILLALGLILGIGVIRSFWDRGQVIDRLSSAADRLAVFQSTLGFIAFAGGIWLIIIAIFWPLPK